MPLELEGSGMLSPGPSGGGKISWQKAWYLFITCSEVLSENLALRFSNFSNWFLAHLQEYFCMMNSFVFVGDCPFFKYCSKMCPFRRFFGSMGSSSKLSSRYFLFCPTFLGTVVTRFFRWHDCFIICSVGKKYTKSVYV